MSEDALRYDCYDCEDLVRRLAATPNGHERRRLLRLFVERHEPAGIQRCAERLKEDIDATREIADALCRCGDIMALGKIAGMPTVSAIGHMVAGRVRLWQDRIQRSLAQYNRASAMFDAQGERVWWARAQIGRIAPCAMLGRFDGVLERAERAADILARAGDHSLVARLNGNLAMALDRMNRPAEALRYLERAWDYYQGAALSHDSVDCLQNRALLFWRLGKIREALAAFREAQRQYRELEAAVDAARQDLHIGMAHLTLGDYAEAVDRLTVARRELRGADSLYLAAYAGLCLAESYLRLGRWNDALDSAQQACEGFTRCQTALDSAQALLCLAQAHAGLQEPQEALDALDRAAAVLESGDTAITTRISLAVPRVQFLLQTGRRSEARALLADAIPALRQAGLGMETAIATLLWGAAALDEHRLSEARAAAGESLAMAEREGLDWLAARALHLRGRAEIRQGLGAAAGQTLAAAVGYLDRVHRRVAWDDRVTFADTAIAVYGDAMALALQQERHAMALRYAERAKAHALADHLRRGVDARPRAHDRRTAALIDEYESLRERYAWLGAGDRPITTDTVPATTVRWEGGPLPTGATRDEMARIERRLGEIWRELQESNPAYRGEAAALDVASDEESALGADDAAAQRWVDSVHATLDLDGGAVLLEYTALEEELVLFIARAGTVRAIHLPGASAEVRRLVLRLRLILRRSAEVISQDRAGLRDLRDATRDVLRRLYAALLAPATPWLDGVTHLHVVPQGPSHHVPFHALHDGQGYLIERLTVAYAPCATLIEHFAERQRLLHDADGGRLQGALVLTCSARGALRHVQQEGTDVVTAFGGRLLREREATRRALRAHVRDYAVLHVAAHGQFRPDAPLFSALHLGDGPLSTADVFDLELGCSLATLSACETALGVAGAGDELMGLSRAFLYAGAPSLVLTLWKVEDRSTAALMRVFYHALRRGASKAAALRQAQLALLHNDVDRDIDASAPFFWAPFQLIGHPGPL